MKQVSRPAIAAVKKQRRKPQCTKHCWIHKIPEDITKKCRIKILGQSPTNKTVLGGACKMLAITMVIYG
jgi:hypothetical protein